MLFMIYALTRTYEYECSEFTLFDLLSHKTQFYLNKIDATRYDTMIHAVFLIIYHTNVSLESATHSPHTMQNKLSFDEIRTNKNWRQKSTNKRTQSRRILIKTGLNIEHSHKQ